MEITSARMSVLKYPTPIGSSTEDILRFPEVYRQLAASLDVVPESQPVIGIISAIRGEGRTRIARELAATLAHDMDSMVTLVDADFEHPMLTESFGLGSVPGLANVVRGEKELTQVAVPVNADLHVVPAGEIQDEAASLLHQLSMSDVFRVGDRLPGVVIVDFPPILNQGYASQAARTVDVLVLVVRAGVTPLDAVRQAVTRLEDLSPRGVVLNGPHSALPSWWPGHGA